MDLGNQIVILPRGFVTVGRVRMDGQFYIVEDGYTVRRWGTSGGLGQLAAEGPLANTVLDAATRQRVHILGVVDMLEATAAKWISLCGDKHPFRASKGARAAK